ncbi:MAG: prepilin-type N-terminal cleavage/methylation domain-containing protein [Minisyncoccia bacterium]
MKTMKKISRSYKKGFTLLEMLLVVAIIAILAGIVIVAINPSKQLGAANDAKRWSDVNTIISAVYQYAIDHGGTLPGPTAIAQDSSCSSATSTNEICITGGSCAGLISLASTTDAGTYLSAMPVDPQGSTSTNGTGYYIVKNPTTSRITVCAPSAAGTATISVTK